MSSLVFEGHGKKWYPNSIDGLEAHLRKLFIPLKPLPGVSPKRCRGITKNIAYALQYLEFLVQIDSDISLSSVLEKQTYKTFVIHGCAVVEAIFYYILVSSGKAAKTQWRSRKKVVGPEFDLDGTIYRQEAEYFCKLPKPILEEMKFETMCKRVEAKKLVTLDNRFYRKLPYLRGLRNRVHIHSIESDTDTDYLKFSRKDFESTKSILKSLLTCHLFPKNTSLDFGFLDPKPAGRVVPSGPKHSHW